MYSRGMQYAHNFYVFSMWVGVNVDRQNILLSLILSVRRIYD